MGVRIKIPYERVAEFCERHGIRKLSLFGSVIRDDFTPDSDVDVLVEFLPGKTPGFAFYSDLPRELSEIVGRDVDMNTPQDLSRYFRREVLDEAEEIYVAP